MLFFTKSVHTSAAYYFANLHSHPLLPEHPWPITGKMRQHNYDYNWDERTGPECQLAVYASLHECADNSTGHACVKMASCCLIFVSLCCTSLLCCARTTSSSPSWISFWWSWSSCIPSAWIDRVPHSEAVLANSSTANKQTISLCWRFWNRCCMWWHSCPTIITSCPSRRPTWPTCSFWIPSIISLHILTGHYGMSIHYVLAYPGTCAPCSHQYSY